MFDGTPLSRWKAPKSKLAQDLAEAADAPVATLAQCLESFVAEERLLVSDGNGYRCEKCTSDAEPVRDAVKRFAIIRTPKVLVLHLKRLLFGCKISKAVAFPSILDISRFLMTNPDSDEGDAPRYRLVAVVEHSGSATGGHYTCKFDASYRTGPAQAEEQEAWYHASDSRVAKSDLRGALRTQAYLLFYEREGGDEGAEEASEREGAEEQAAAKGPQGSDQDGAGGGDDGGDGGGADPAGE